MSHTQYYLVTLASPTTAPQILLQILEQKALGLADEVVKGFAIAPKRSLTAPCGFVLPFVLHSFLDLVTQIAERRSTLPILVLRSDYGKALGAMVNFANSVWTDQEMEAYQNCSCRQHDRPGVKPFNNRLLNDKVFGNPRPNSLLYTIVAAAFGIVSQIPLSIGQSTKDAIRLERNSKKRGRWPTSFSELVPQSTRATLDAYTRWAQFARHPAPIRGLCTLEQFYPSLEPLMVQSVHLLPLLTSLFSEFVTSLQGVTLEELSLVQKKSLQCRTKDFFDCLHETWFQDLRYFAQIDDLLTSALTSFYHTTCNLLLLLDGGYVGEQGAHLKERFVQTALKIHSSLSTFVPDLGSLHPLLAPYDGDTDLLQCIYHVSGTLSSLVFFRSQPKCAHIPCTNTPKRTKVKFKMCAGCQTVRYCSKECQVADWKEHKPACKVMKCVLPLALSHRADDQVHVPQDLADKFSTCITDGDLTATDVYYMSDYVSTRRSSSQEQELLVS